MGRRSRRRLGRVHVLAVAAAAVAAAAAGGVASSDRSGRWPDGEIRVYDASGWDRALALALVQWNEAGLGVRFVRARAREDADVLVVSDEERVRRKCADSCAAFVTRIGYRPGSTASEVVLPARSAGEREQPGLKDVQLVVHELGHILGVRHRDEECKVMNPELARSCHPLLSSGEWLCGPLPRDVRKAAKLYGVRPAYVDPYCLT